MFADAIEKALGFVRPIKTISRMYKSNDIIPRTATMFFVNGEGEAVTSRHVAEEIMKSARLNSRYESFRKERSGLPPEANMRIEINRMERRYDYAKGESKVQLRYHFPGCYEKIARLGIEMHTFYDLALIKLSGQGACVYKGCGELLGAAKKPRVGMSVAGIGYPVTEFDDFQLSREKDEIQWTTNGTHTVTPYPAQGMIVRIAKNDENRIMTFEVSGFRGDGYCGAPVFDQNGTVLGMVTGSVTRMVDGQPMILTECVSAEIIRSFLKEKNVRFHEA
ncbi:MAG: trypsin-like peptidase domain-containing protein [Lachnospiraceae bacterium]|nr:trypsin-like peptidase domain-containing protein [Lachnospiraceae bacterium]